MKNSNRFKLGMLVILFIGFQKLVAQPRFIIQDKVVFMTGNAQAEAAVAAPKPPPPTNDSIIQDVVVFIQVPEGAPRMIPLDSIHKKLLALKKGRYESSSLFSWYNPHPTTSTQLEGFTILIIAPQTNKILAEMRFVRQKTNVWIDLKFNKPANPVDIKSIVYSESNRKAMIETFGGYKFSFSINAQTGNIDVTPFRALATDTRLLNNAEVHIYKTGKLY
jgi:hypothetical protein